MVAITDPTTRFFIGGPWTFIQTASGTESPITWGISTDATGALLVQNSTGGATIFGPSLIGRSADDSTGLTIIGQSAVDTDSTTGCLELRTYTGPIGTPVAPGGSKVPFFFRGGATTMARITNVGGFQSQGGSASTVQVGASGTALTQIRNYAPSITPSSVAANTSAEQTFTVTGLATTDVVYVDSPAALVDGVSIVGVRASATNTLAVRFMNNTGSSKTPVSGTYPVVAIRS